MDLWSHASGVWGSTMMYPHQIGRPPPQNSWTLTPRLSWGIRLRVVPYTHSHLDKVQKHFIYIWHGFVKPCKWGLRLNHDVPTSDRSVPTPKFLKIYHTQWGYRAKGGAIYPFTAYQGAETLYIYMIWICEAMQVGFEAQPWCTHIRQVGPHPKIPENWPEAEGY
jgi:hypothetical protein